MKTPGTSPGQNAYKRCIMRVALLNDSFPPQIDGVSNVVVN